MKKVLAIVLALAMVLSMAACGAKTTTTTTTTTEPAKLKVGICQLVQHPALDAATQGFMDAIEAEMPGQVDFDNQNASGDAANCATIVNGFVAANVDLIMANATPALQAAASATADIPVLATSITDYASALELDNFNGTIGTNVSGTSDLAPLDQQAAMFKEWLPEVKTVGILYCSAEANSVYQAEAIAALLAAEGIQTEMFSFTDTNDVASVTQNAASKVDALYIPTDNTAASNTEAIANILIPAGIPAIVGEEGICKGCGIATLSISYYDLGYATGLMAAKILKGEANVSEMPIEYAPNVTKEYNANVVEQLGLTVPSADYVAIAE